LELTVDYKRYEQLDITQDGGITTVTLNRPEVKNAINSELHDELALVFNDLDMDPACDVVILTGAGDAFCGGGDINWILEQTDNPLMRVEANRMNRRFQQSILDFEKPAIAKVRGPAIGLGCSLALYCDFVYATPDAIFADPHVAVGLVAGDGGCVVWPQLVGYARARRYLLTGDSIRGSQAAEIGLITEAVPEEQLDEVVATMANRMLTGAKYAIRYTKSAINAALKVNAQAVIDRASAFETLTQTLNDNRIAAEAFLAKEKPKFTGR
jgi:enoyl-CoA hydratase